MSTHHNARLLLPAVLATFVLAGCGGSAPGAIAFTDEAPAIDEPDLVGLSDEERLLIDFHAEWICELERRTFAALEQSEELLAETLEAAQIDRDTYDDFVTETLSRQDVRDAVFYQYTNRCWP